VLGLVRTLLALGLDLVEHPDRSMGWDHTDAGLLQSIGRLSGAIAGALDTASAADPQLHDAMHRRGGVFLDIGTGTGWLAIAIARTFPNLQVVGIDLFEPALDLARSNVRDEGLQDRIELRLQDATELDDATAYDAIWVALPFIPPSVVPAILDATRRALRPGGIVIPGTFNQSPDRLGQLLVDLRTLRSGGHPWRPTELCDLLTAAGYEEARRLERTWAAPVELYVGR
jgi:SAM-dependent methyltransferase